MEMEYVILVSAVILTVVLSVIIIRIMRKKEQELLQSKVNELEVKKKCKSILIKRISMIVLRIR